MGWQLAKDANCTLGGLASIELMRRSFSARGWLDDSSALVAVAPTPGTNAGYCAGLVAGASHAGVAVAWRRHSRSLAVTR
jgi:hypothetical protein